MASTVDLFEETRPWSVRKHWHVVGAFLSLLATMTTFVSYSDLTSQHDIRLLDSPAAMVFVVLPLAGLVVWPLLPSRIPRAWNIAAFVFSLLCTLTLLFIITLETSIVESTGNSVAQHYPDYPGATEAFKSLLSGLFSFGFGFYCLIAVGMILTYSYFRGFRGFRRVSAIPPPSSP